VILAERARSRFRIPATPGPGCGRRSEVQFRLRRRLLRSGAIRHRPRPDTARRMGTHRTDPVPYSGVLPYSGLDGRAMLVGQAAWCAPCHATTQGTGYRRNTRRAGTAKHLPCMYTTFGPLRLYSCLGSIGARTYSSALSRTHGDLTAAQNNKYPGSPKHRSAGTQKCGRWVAAGCLPNRRHHLAATVVPGLTSARSQRSRFCCHKASHHEQGGHLNRQRRDPTARD